jgi:hypothetical protein
MAGPPRAATAQFTPVFGSTSGQIRLASYNTIAGGAAPFFNVDGQMLQAGGFFPRLNGINTNAVNVVGALPLAAASGVVGNYGGGAANLFALGGGQAALVSTNYRVSDFNVANGVASATTLGGTAQWRNLTGFNLTRFGGGFGSVFVNLGGKAGAPFAEFGIDCLIEVGNGFGAGFVPVNSFQSFIAYGYDGVNAPTFTVAPATGAGIFGFSSVFNTVNHTARFSAAAMDPITILAGQTVRITGTLTIFGDPADVTFDTFPLDGSIPIPDFGPGGASNAALVAGAPEPGTLGLLICGALGLCAVFLYRARHAPAL